MLSRRVSVRERPRPVALRATRLFDGDSRGMLIDPVVVLVGSRIVSVHERGVVPVEAQLVDLGAATLLPGLVDTHVHLALDASGDPVGALAARDDEAALSAMRQAARTALMGGVTTVRDLGDRDYLAVRLRGDPDLPTIVASGPPLTTPQGHCHFLGGSTLPDPQSVRAAVRDHVQHGVDVIKIMASGGELTPGSSSHLTQFDQDCLRAAVDEAHRHGLPITAHAHARASVANAVAAGMDSIEHATFWSADGIDEPGKLIDTIAASCIVISASMGLLPSPAAAPPPRVAARLPAVAGIRRRMHAAGTIIVVGTDAGIGPPNPTTSSDTAWNS